MDGEQPEHPQKHQQRRSISWRILVKAAPVKEDGRASQAPFNQQQGAQNTLLVKLPRPKTASSYPQPCVTSTVHVAEL